MSGGYRTIVADPPWPYRDGPLPGFGKGRLPAFLPYRTMTVAKIERIPVRGIVSPAAHVYLWTTSRFIWDARAVADAWGVKVAQVCVWCKAPMGLGPGSAFANTAEFFLFGRTRVGPLITEARSDAGLSRADVHRSIFDTVPTGIVYRWEADDCLPTPSQWDSLRRLLPGLIDVGDLASEPNRQPSSWFEWKRGAHSQKPEAFFDLVEQVSPGPYVELFSRHHHRLGWDVWGDESANTAALLPAARIASRTEAAG